MALLRELEAIYEKVAADPENVDEGTRRRFWRIVGRIKRTSTPDERVVRKAAEIRDILYEHKLGKPRRLGWLTLWFISGVLCVYLHIWAVTVGPAYTGDFLHDFVVVMGLRGMTVAGAVGSFYPFGRLLAGKLTGIRFDGITRDIYYLPTLKINYVSYLKASPPRRQWFFFLAGAWTVITATWVGLLGFILASEWIGLAIAAFLAISEAIGAVVGGKWAGEMGHFKRERRIVRDWKKSLGR